jgi:hypothetical protein
MLINRGRPPQRLRGDSREATKETGQAEADAAFIGESDLSGEREQRAATAPAYKYRRAKLGLKPDRKHCICHRLLAPAPCQESHTRRLNSG